MAEVERSVKLHSEVPSGDVALSGRYTVYGEIASGGMASVQYGRLLGPHGFNRPVAIKRLHPHFAKEPDFLAMFIDEARLSARLVHANIIHTLDVIEAPGELALVMEYVHGESLWALLRLSRERGTAIPVNVASALIASALHGLHAAHEALSDTGEPLHIVHRDVSPQNILIGADGMPRLLDFGIAKALGRMRSTPNGEIKGKLGYIAPEQLHASHVDRRTDVYGASAVLWETLTGTPLFDGPSEPAIVHRVLYDTVEAPSTHRKEVPSSLDDIVLRGLKRDMNERFATAQDMALAIERSVRLATQSEIAAWLSDLAGERLAQRAKLLAAMQDPKQQAQLKTAGTRRIQQTHAATMHAALPTAAAPARGGGGSDSSLHAVITHTMPPLRAQRSRAWALGVALVTLAIGTLWAVLAASDARLRTAAGYRSSMPVPVETATAAAVATPLVSEPPALTGNAAGAGSSAPASPAAEASGAHPAASTRRKPRRADVPSGAPIQTGSPQSDNPCVPFYRIDAQGIRRPKPECL